MKGATYDGGSFRDSSGRIFLIGERIFRTVMPCASTDFEFVEATGLIESLIEKRFLVGQEIVEHSILGSQSANAVYVLEHPRIPFISYPYEWSFPTLKAAALLHLDIHLQALDVGVTLSDASAYNVQFLGSHPIFIDRLSFRRYQDGEFWTGHGQFCNHFLNPLLLRSICGIPHNAWYRGSLEGITAVELDRLLPWTKFFSWRLLLHVTLQAKFQKSARRVEAQDLIRKKSLPIAGFKHMLRGLRNWITDLEPADTGKTVWADYPNANCYSTDEARSKRDFIADFIKQTSPDIVWDIGCNTGDYAKVALDAGAKFVIGFDSDQGALDLAFSRSVSENLQLLPIFVDVANPSPCQGWAEGERGGISQRQRPNAILALALVHHLAIARNIPLPELVIWLLSMAPTGVVEFVPKNDPMVQELLSLRDDIFEEYTADNFIRQIERSAVVRQVIQISASGRILVWYEPTLN